MCGCGTREMGRKGRGSRPFLRLLRRCVAVSLFLPLRTRRSCVVWGRNGPESGFIGQLRSRRSQWWWWWGLAVPGSPLRCAGKVAACVDSVGGRCSVLFPAVPPRFLLIFRYQDAVHRLQHGHTVPHIPNTHVLSCKSHCKHVSALPLWCGERCFCPTPCFRYALSPYVLGV